MNVRLALKHAINRQELVDKILFGHGTVGNDQPIGPSYRFYDGDIPQTTYDPDKAKFYLKEAGLDSLEVTLSAADAAFPGAVDSAVLYQDEAAKAGINLTVNRVPNDGYWSDVWLKAPFCAVYWGGRADRGPDLHHGLCVGCGLERQLLGQCAVQRIAGGRARRARRAEAGRDVLRDAAARLAGRRHRAADVRELRLRDERQDRSWRHGVELRLRRRALDGALVVRLI